MQQGKKEEKRRKEIAVALGIEAVFIINQPNINTNEILLLVAIASTSPNIALCPQNTNIVRNVN